MEWQRQSWLGMQHDVKLFTSTTAPVREVFHIRIAYESTDTMQKGGCKYPRDYNTYTTDIQIQQRVRLHDLHTYARALYIVVRTRTRVRDLRGQGPCINSLIKRALL